MQRKFHSKAFCTAFAAALIAFTTYALLDIFVIPRSYSTVAAAPETTVTASQAETEASDTAESAEDTAQAAAENTALMEDLNDGSTVIGDYSDDNITIVLRQYRELDTNIYVADVQLSSLDYLKTAFAENTYGKNIKELTSTIASNVGAVLAINGDFYGAQESGYVIRNGVLYRDEPSGSEDLAIMADGSFEIIQDSDTTAQSLLDDGAQQVFSFGPGLLIDGGISVTEDEEVGNAAESNPRTAIAQVGDLHYLLVVADGRTDENAGLSLYELAQFLQARGAVTAYNLDGGGSSTMVFKGSVINHPINKKEIRERNVSDIVYIG